MRRLNYDELLKDILTKAAELSGTRNGYIFLADGDRKQMSLKFGIGQFESMIGLALRPGQGMIGRVRESGQLIVVDDYRYWEHRIPNKQFGRPSCHVRHTAQIRPKSSVLSD